MFAKVCTLAGVADGDLIFFMRDTAEKFNEFETAVISVSNRRDVFHVGMFCRSSSSIVHAIPEDGVVVESVDDALLRIDAHSVEVYLVDVKKSIRDQATIWALDRVGAKYNDIFSPNAVNSFGVEAYYCCQLMDKAYVNSGLSFLCPPHKLNFMDAKGEVLPFWVSYFEKKASKIPQGEPGSHPAKLITSPHLRKRLEKCLRPMGKLNIPKTVDSALHFLRGARTTLAAAKSFNVFQPRNGEKITECTIADAMVIETVVEDAKEIQPAWAATSAQQRGVVLRNAASIIRESAEELAYLETLDTGKPITESRWDVKSSADCFDFFGGVSHNLAGNHFPLDGDRFAYTIREPWGVVGAVGVWNYPMQTASWKIAPALACGNAVVYKPSPLAPITCAVLAQILQHSGLPDGLLSVVQGDGETGRALCMNAGIDKVTFTGSSETGSKVLCSCSLNGHVKPATLELGGKSSCIVFADADVELAVTGSLMANFFTQGEVCSNASKVFVHKSIFNEFREKVVNATKRIRIGDPMREDTRYGAMISREHLQKVKRFIDEARQQGANVLCGGNEVHVKGLEGGFYLSPAVIENVTESMRIYREEIFGAVMLLIPFDSNEEVVRLANDTPYGLAAGLFTRDLKNAYVTASRLQAGNVYINTFNDTNAMVPFGGMKQSGFGRENGVAALEAFSQIKSVFVNASGNLENPFESK